MNLYIFGSAENARPDNGGRVLPGHSSIASVFQV